MLELNSCRKSAQDTSDLSLHVYEARLFAIDLHEYIIAASCSIANATAQVPVLRILTPRKDFRYVGVPGKDSIQ